MKFTALVAAAVLAAPAMAAPLLGARQAVCDAGAVCPAAEGDASTLSVGVVPTGQQWIVYDDAIEDQAIVYDYVGEAADPWTTLFDQGLDTFNRTYSYTVANGEVRVTLPGTTKIDNPGLLFSVSFNSTLARDRGDVSLYCGTELIGTGSQFFDGDETISSTFLKLDNFPCTPGYVVLKNDRGAAFMAFDSVRIDYA